MSRLSPGGPRETGVAAWAFAGAAGRVMGTTRPPAVFATLGRLRRTYWGWLTYSALLMPFGHLRRSESEMVILRVAHRCGSDYEWDHHRRIGRRAGLSDAQIEDLHGEARGTCWSHRERTVLECVDALVTERDLDDDRWHRLRGVLTERETLELLMLVGQYSSLATTLSVLRVTPDPRG